MRTDLELQRDVIAELKWQPSLQNEEIGVAVKGGVATLSGDVTTYGRKIEAERAAGSVHGVKAVAVDMNVKLRTSFFHTDSEIAHAALAALKWHAEVPDDKIRIRVEDGRILLEGDAEWHFQRTAAEHAVQYLSGVKSVSNLISVKPRKVSSDNVTRKIHDAFKRSAEIDSSHITVETTDSRVTLKGNVRSWAERRDAEDAAWSAPGVIQVDDRLVVAAF